MPSDPPAFTYRPGWPEPAGPADRQVVPTIPESVHREPAITRRRAETSVLDLVLPPIPPPAYDPIEAGRRALDGLDLDGAIDRDHARRGLAARVTPPSPRLGALVNRACQRIESATGCSGSAIRMAVADAVQGAIPADHATVQQIARALLAVARTGVGEHGQALLTPEQIADFEIVLG